MENLFVNQKIIEFVQKIKDNEQIIRYKKLENFINNNDEIKEKFNELKKIQKDLVYIESKSKQNTVNYEEKKRLYNDILESISEKPLVLEYLELQQIINSFLKEISLIITEEINKPL